MRWHRNLQGRAGAHGEAWCAARKGQGGGPGWLSTALSPCLSPVSLCAHRPGPHLPRHEQYARRAPDHPRRRARRWSQRLCACRRRAIRGGRRRREAPPLRRPRSQARRARSRPRSRRRCWCWRSRSPRQRRRNSSRAGRRRPGRVARASGGGGRGHGCASRRVGGGACGAQQAVLCVHCQCVPLCQRNPTCVLIARDAEGTTALNLSARMGHYECIHWHAPSQGRNDIGILGIRYDNLLFVVVQLNACVGERLK